MMQSFHIGAILIWVALFVYFLAFGFRAWRHSDLKRCWQIMAVGQVTVVGSQYVIPAGLYALVIWFSIYAFLAHQFYRHYMSSHEAFAKYCFHAYCAYAALSMALILVTNYGLYVSGMGFAVTVTMSFVTLIILTLGHIRVSEVKAFEAHQ